MTMQDVLPRPHSWVLSMRWHRLLFAHWRVPAAALRPHLPLELEPDEFDGSAWLGVVPFRMTGVRPRCLPALPRLSSFCELNVRTYVTRGGRPGVWFFSLDAADRIAVRAARAGFHLPYFDARMRLDVGEGGWIHYHSERSHRGAPAASFAARYRPDGEPFRAAPGSLEEFLTARHCLYTVDRRGRVLRGDIFHEPWPLQRAEWRVTTCDMTRLLGLSLPPTPPHLLYAQELTVRAALPRVVG